MTLADRMVEAAARAIIDARLWPGAWIKANETEMNAARHEARVSLTAALALAEAEGAKFVRWPPTGDDVQACSDEVNPYAATAEQYGLTVETVCDVIDVWMNRATLAGRVWP